MPQPSDSRSRRRWMTGAVLLLILALLAYAVFQFGVPPARPPKGPAEPMAARDKDRLWRLKEQGVAQLENHKYAAAREALEPIAEALPADPLGPRNLAIAHLLALETNESTPDQALAAVAALQQVEPEQATTDILAARTLALTGDYDAALNRLNNATAKYPQDAAVWFALGSLQRDAADENVRSQAGAAFQRAFELAPENLAAAWNLLQIQAEQQQPDIEQTLRAARPLVSPINAQAIEAGTDLEQEIDQALQAAASGQLDETYRRAFIVANVIKAQPQARRDGLALSPHPLAYVVQDFEPAFYEDWTATDTEDEIPATEPAIDVRLQPLPAEEQLSPLGAVTDFAVADFDLDERYDLIVLRENRVEVYVRPNGGNAWHKLCEVEVPAGMQRVVVADFDDDVTSDATPQTERCHNVDVDLMVYGAGGAVVLQNQLDGGVRKLVAMPQSPQWQQSGPISAAAIFDVDHDAMLDIVTAAAAGISLWQNRSGFQFQLLETVPYGESGDAPQTLLPVDWDRDIDLDVLLAGTKAAAAELLQNHRHGQFSRQPWADGFAPIASAHDTAILDADGNGSWDVVTAGDGGISLLRTETLDDSQVQLQSATQISPTAAEGIVVWDYDNDGRFDLLAWSDAGMEIFRGDGAGGFELVEGLWDPPPTGIIKCAAADIDGDGDLDVIVAARDGITIYDNEGGNANHWLNIRLLAEQEKGGASPDPGGRVNYHGIGSLLELRLGDRYVPVMVNGQMSHFGLGRQNDVERVRIIWANGFPQNIVDPPGDAHICDQKLLLGSCPYLYTWNGERFEFCTDLCWAAPLGLKFAEDVYAPSRAWEYLKIDGRLLQPREEGYVLQVTEELWEAAYFDLIRLIAVDHPAEVDIFTNEKVGPAEMAAPQIHTVRAPRLPLAVSDAHGRDLLPQIRAADGIFAKPFKKRIRQGLVEDHFVELDFGDLAGAERITLFLTGWVYPTDTSLNIRLARDANLPSPTPPSLWVPDAEGVWQQVIPYTGFPGGKTKTIAIDISDVFLTDDYRVRLATNMEFYWDAMFVTTDEAPAEYVETELQLRSADLHYRGYSVIEHPAGHGPDRYVYDRLQENFAWPPMRGHFTRYGDVTDLFTSLDDRMAIIGSGDEITLTFAPPDRPLPEGWTRDFVMHNVGWDKDANLNTAYGQDVEPLPFAAMSGYPYVEPETYPLTPGNREYLKRYQTRVQDWSRFWRAMQSPTDARTP